MEMTQITQDQREQLQDAAGRLTEKLRAFREGLTADERAVLGVGLWQAMSEEAGMVEDVAGLAISEGPAWQFVKELGKTIAIDLIYEGLKSVDWGKAFSNPTGYPPGPDPRIGV
jgi:hypothetical protein